MRKFNKTAIFALCGMMLLSSCASPFGKEEEAVRENILVKTETAKVQKIEQKNDFMGRVMPDSTVFIVPKVPGEVIEINVDVGDHVKKGQVLFQLDATIDELQLEQAAAAVEMAKAGLQQATGATYEQQLLQAEGQINQAKIQKKWTDKTYDAYDTSFEANLGSLSRKKKQVEKTVKDLEAQLKKIENVPDETPMPDPEAKPTNSGVPAMTTAGKLKTKLKDALYEAKSGLLELEKTYADVEAGYEPQYNQLTQGLEQIEAGLDVAERAYDLATGEAHKEQLATIEAQLKQAQSAYKMALQKLKYSSVESPIDGIVEQKNISLHGFATQEAPALVVTEKSSVNVTFGVSAETASNIKEGDIVTVYDGDREYPATVVEVSSFIDAKSGLYNIKANVKNSDGLLMSGSSVKLSAVTRKNDEAVVIPVSAIYDEGDETFVYVNEDGIARKRKVSVGIMTDKMAEIATGVMPGDEVITTWNPGLIDGAALDIKKGE